MTYSYLAYGIILRSKTAIPGLQQISAPKLPTDVEFFWGEEPEWVTAANRKPSREIRTLPVENHTTDSTLRLSEVGQREYFRFAYSDGTEFVLDAPATRIWGTCAPPLVLEDLATYLVGPVMGFVLRRRGITPLHACAVEIGGAAVAISGPGGAGKSTTAAALALQGTPVLCEDVTPLCEKDGEFYVLPGYPRVCLWPDSVELLLGSQDALPRITPTWEKCFLALNGERELFEGEPKRLSAIYFLGPRTEECPAPQIKEVRSGDALLQLVQNTYMNQLLSKQQRAAEFDVLGRVATKVSFRKLIPADSRGKDPGLKVLCDLILKDASALPVQGERAAQLGKF